MNESTQDEPAPDGRPVAIVTGAARGIGAAIAEEFGRRGYDLVLADVLGDELKATAQRAVGPGPRGSVEAQVGDLSDLRFAKQLIDSAIAGFGRIDVLVNNAAWRDLVTLRNVSLESWERTLRVGLTVPAFMSAWAAEHKERRGKGVIVNISSIQADMAGGYAASYVASKGALDSLTFDIATQYGPRGIRCVAVRPGAIDTDMNRVFRSPDGNQVSDRIMEHATDMIPLRRQGRPEEIARTVAWLASDDASYITGTTITVDGGWSTQINPYSLKHLMFPDEYS
jgi:NAD(P)-dependent dehydrogenase (short-subunit alcohol dehydrogenase family)